MSRTLFKDGEEGPGGCRGDVRNCADCGYDVMYGGGHKVEDDQTHERLWICCPCFEKSLMAYIEALKADGK